MDKLDCVVTTAHKPNEKMIAMAEAAARQFKTRYIARGNLAMADIKCKFAVPVVLVMTKNGWVLNTAGGDLFFHLNMANLRIKGLQAGQSDNMVKAMRLEAGMTVLDCTLGLASDAIVSSFVVGAGGRVCGLEVSPYTAFIVQEGLQSFIAKDAMIDAALRRIEVILADYREYLLAQPDQSYDIVYLDPMFRRPISESLHLQPLRYVADHSAVSSEILAQAKRVARQRVVFKENSRGREFERLAFSTVVGGKYSSIHYGVMELNEKK